MRALEADRCKRDSNHAQTHTKLYRANTNACMYVKCTAHAVAAMYKHGFAVVGGGCCAVLLLESS